MYGILQRKYELMRGPGAGGRGLPERSGQMRDMGVGVLDATGEGKRSMSSTSSAGSDLGKGKEKESSNDRSSQEARQRMAMNSLADFFGV